MFWELARAARPRGSPMTAISMGAYMPTALAENQETIGGQLYFFKSPRDDCDQCLILGHAGWAPHFKKKATFTVPDGITLEFRTYDSENNRSSINTELERMDGGYVPKLASSLPSTDESNQIDPRKFSKASTLLVDLDGKDRTKFVGGEECKNYVVMKGVGYHWDQLNPNDTSYTTIASEIKASTTKPHFVSVRNRGWPRSAYIMLEDILKEVLARYPSIKEFYMAGCRGIIANPNWKPTRTVKITSQKIEAIREMALKLRRKGSDPIRPEGKYLIPVSREDIRAGRFPEFVLSDYSLDLIAKHHRVEVDDVKEIVRKGPLTNKLVGTDDQRKILMGIRRRW